MKVYTRISFLFIFVLNAFFIFVSNKKFRYYSYDEIISIFNDLAKKCPQYIKIDTSQRRYGLPSAGECGKNKEKCQNLIVFMTDFNTMNSYRPHIYISGLLHGDEVIGATTLTELALYMCNNDKDRHNRDRNSKENWVLDLLKKTYFVFTPMTNAYGYSNGIREDYVTYSNGNTGLEDPNRDFPYFNITGKVTNDCMKTVAARTVNELFREHIFVNALTFHGGLNAIGYPWGNYVHLLNEKLASEAPDFYSGRQTALILQKYSSSSIPNNNIPDYTIGDMVEMVIILIFYFIDFRVILLMVVWKTGLMRAAGKTKSEISQIFRLNNVIPVPLVVTV